MPCVNFLHECLIYLHLEYAAGGIRTVLTGNIFGGKKKMKDSSGSCIAPGYHHWESNLEVWFVIKEDWFLKYLCFIGLTTRVKFSSLFKASRSSSFWALSKRQQESFLEFQRVLIRPSEIFLLVWKCGVRTAELLVLKVQMYIIT